MVATKPARRALLVGNDVYYDEHLSRLSAPAADVYRLQQVLKKPTIGGFDDVRLLLNASRDDVEREIGALFNRASPDDLALLYFAGHGVLNASGELFLALNNTQVDQLFGTAVPANFIKQVMNHSRSRRQILILDCCHSGAFGRSGGTRKAIGTPALTEATFEVHGYGREILTASSATQLAWEKNELLGEIENAVFTHFLVEGLETGTAAPGSATITVEQLYNYVHDKVVEVAPGMTPQRWADRQQGSSILLARNPTFGGRKASVIVAVPVPDSLDALLRSDDPVFREAGVRAVGAGLRSGDVVRAKAAEERLRDMEGVEKHVDVRDAIYEVFQAAEVASKNEAERSQVDALEKELAEAAKRAKTAEERLRKLEFSQAAEVASKNEAERQADVLKKDAAEATERAKAAEERLRELEFSQATEVASKNEAERRQVDELQKELAEAAKRAKTAEERLRKLEFSQAAATERAKAAEEHLREREFSRAWEVASKNQAERRQVDELQKELAEATERAKTAEERLRAMEEVASNNEADRRQVDQPKKELTKATERERSRRDEIAAVKTPVEDYLPPLAKRIGIGVLTFIVIFVLYGVALNL